MKKLFTLLSLVVGLLLILCSCGHEHTWSEATCTEPKTCSECGETEGDPVGHTWVEATCTEPKTCSRCGETEGNALGHTWIEATCTEPKTCSRCGETEGEPVGHILADWEKEYEYLIGGKETKQCTKCKEIIEERFGDRGEKNKTDLFSGSGMELSKKEYMKQLLAYLPEDCALCTEDIYDSGAWDKSTFAIVDSSLNDDSKYIRICYFDADYLDNEEPNKQHIDIYFDDGDAFIDVADAIFRSVDYKFTKSNNYTDELERISTRIENQSEREYSVKMTNGYFVYRYTAPYKIWDTWYPGFHTVRFLTSDFYKEIYG